MIGKITGGGSFGGALAYLTQPKEKGREQEGRERLREVAPSPEERAPGWALSPVKVLAWQLHFYHRL